MKEPYTIKLAEGQSVVIYHNGKVLIKKSYKECGSIFTAWDSFLGTTEEVEAKIKELGLIEIKSPKSIIPTISNRSTTPPTASYATPPVSAEANGSGEPTKGVIASVWGSITSLFKTNSNQ